ncbi:hypothetical protein VMCG_02136 [Cytospora schulzeri]|uniref:RNA-dependent RNA polymerase n=1 Tax=Cytospora schulzeri TaxID=448051 RepID=A0A423X445_9PEZI|nr:hypothetical protein VMCG_02136 [Valsa malicola]
MASPEDCFATIRQKSSTEASTTSPPLLDGSDISFGANPPSNSSYSSSVQDASNRPGHNHGSDSIMPSRDVRPAVTRRDHSLQSSSSSQSSGPRNVSESQPNRHVQSRRQNPTHAGDTAVQLESASLKDFSSIVIMLDRLPKNITTQEIWDSLTSMHLSVSRIELLENNHGERVGKAKIYIAPPPSRWPPWSGSRNICLIKRKDSPSLQVPILSTTPNRAGAVKSPHNRYISRQLDIALDGLRFGMLAHESTMFELPQYHYQDVGMAVKFFRKEFEIKFKTNLGRYGTKEFMMRIDFRHIKKILHITRENGESALVILLPSPPKFYCLMPASCDDTQSLWQEWDLWARQTEITHARRKLKELPAGLRNQPDQIVDIGRWTAYYFGMTPATLSLWERIASYLSDYNIKSEMVTNFRLTPPGPINVWMLLDSSIDSLSLESLHLSHSFHLPFEVRYQLEVCISQGLINEYNIGVGFLQKLTTFGTTQARMILEGVAEENLTFYDPMEIFEHSAILNYWPNARVPADATLVRRAVITPTRIYFQTPCVELTNRVLREYSGLNDHFLRVQFTDELTFGKIYSSPQNSKKDDNVYLRVHRVLSNGIIVGGRRYRFLAFSNSQFRENGAFFFCETDHDTCDTIRNWMGDFQHIRSVGKYAARMGQCFTTTRRVRGISVRTIRHIADIERNMDGRVWSFTDGVGKISSFLATVIANERNLLESSSCFQMRMGGCKGVLVVWPDVPPGEVHIRPSQEKFEARYKALEIIKTSSYSHATLNKQIIPILSALGVEDSVFEEMLNEELEAYVRGLSDSLKAGELLRSRVDENQVTLTMAEMVDTFMDSNEPFLRTILDLWKCWVLKRLKYKAAISVKESAMVYGVVDELGVLRGHSKQAEGKGHNRIETLPQIFLQVPIEAWNGSSTTNYKVITGICVVGRNPSLHAGDVRVVQAVDLPELRHLKNVVVFPQTGDRDIPSMCSGGDLDGDDYFVFWDKRLIPTEWNHPPMDHDANSGTPTVEGSNDVSIEDIARFFVQYMKNDSLGAIATAHFAQADHVGVKHPKCIELAKLHSQAVDYIKSGTPAIMARHLRPQRWPHWMEKEPKYHSTSVVGKIYDCMCIMTESMEWHPAYEMAFDQRILTRYQLDEKTLAKAREIKTAYDIAMRRLMGQHEAPVTEFEIWSTFILSKPRVGSDYKLQENVGREVSALKERFRTVCIETVTGVEQKQSYAYAYSMIDREQLDQFVAAMYTVTYDQVQAALRERSTPRMDEEGERVEFEMPLISFPWLFHRELARVALGREGDVRPLRRPALAKDSPQKRHGVEGKVMAAGTTKDVGDMEAPEKNLSELTTDDAKKKPEIVQEVRSNKQGGHTDDADEDIGEDGVRISSGKVVQRGQVLDLFNKEGKGGLGSQRTPETTAGTFPVAKTSIPETNHISNTLDGGTLGGSLSVPPASDHEDDEDDEEFEEVENVLMEEEDEEDALQQLARKIGM